ncbi:MAG: hypothetical protein WDZ61_00955 [Parcubacteria group bacterium]
MKRQSKKEVLSTVVGHAFLSGVMAFVAFFAAKQAVYLAVDIMFMYERTAFVWAMYIGMMESAALFIGLGVVTSGIIPIHIVSSWKRYKEELLVLPLFVA